MLASVDALDNVAEASETLRDQLEAERLAHAEARLAHGPPQAGHIWRFHHGAAGG
jgi:hypothetical protein